MKHFKWISVVCVLVVGFGSCATTDYLALIRTENRENLVKLEVGMDKSEVH